MPSSPEEGGKTSPCRRMSHIRTCLTGKFSLADGVPPPHGPHTPFLTRPHQARLRSPARPCRRWKMPPRIQSLLSSHLSFEQLSMSSVILCTAAKCVTGSESRRASLRTGATTEIGGKQLRCRETSEERGPGSPRQTPWSESWPVTD